MLLISIANIGIQQKLVAQNIDINWLRSINKHETNFKNKFSNICANSVTPLSFGVPISIYTYDALKHKNYKKSKALIIGFSLLSASAITTTLKYSIDRTRPFVTYPDIVKRSTGGSPSFPSGHTSSAFALATSVSLQYPKWYIVAPAYIWASSVGYSRMYQGVHYPSDVLVGAIIGSGTSWLCYYLNKKYILKKTKKQ
ncbi:MAG: phosphatase PAP2 family protein [Bacteroidetes bacterium]|nr:phosphatase PAP2 family protein [Bacteroidota bacterium]